MRPSKPLPPSKAMLVSGQFTGLTLAMLSLALPLPGFAQSPPPPETILQPQKVLPLPGGLDQVKVFNSNSPEVVSEAGILLSTFPPQGMATPAAHLNTRFQGRFDIFAHHIAKPATPEDLRTLYLGVIAQNPTHKPVMINILQAASYVSQPDAPFIPLPEVQNNNLGMIYAGPGDRVMTEILRGQRQAIFPPQVVIPPQSSALLLNLPISVKELTPPLNGRSALLRLRSNGPVYLASLGLYARQDAQGQETPPSLEDWQTLLKTGSLVTPRDKPPSVPGAPGAIIYSRVAGVGIGSRWQNQTTQFKIPAAGERVSFPLSTVMGGTFGTGQVQAAPLIARYPDTAYQAHGNYGIQYDLTFPLFNPTNQPQTITLTIQSPVKTNLAEPGLKFLNPPPNRIFFRGTVRFRYRDDAGTPQSQSFHLVQKQGQQGPELLRLTLQPQETRLVQVNFLYPPDATPVQVLTLANLTQP